MPINPFSGAVVQQGTPGSILEAFKPGTEPGSNYTADIEDPGVVPPGVTAQAGEGQGSAIPATPSSSPPMPTTISTGTGGLY